MNNFILILSVILMTVLGSFGGFYFKMASSSGSSVQILRNIHLYYGLVLYGAGAILNIIVLKYMPYSVVLPMTSITYVWTLLSSHFFLKEKITRFKIVGIISIISGSILIGIS